MPGLIILGVFLLLILVLVIRALLFKDKTNYNKEVKEIKELDDVVSKLGTLVKIKTISYEDKNKIDFSEYQRYIDKVKELYPLVFSKCEFTETKEYAIKLKLKGKSSDNPTVLMAHYDVVPVTEEWDHDPFLGEVVNDSLYGRGVFDTKCTMVCALSALELALKNDYVPNNDLYLCFGSNEEVYGDSQIKIIEEMKKAGIKIGLVLDEGGGIMNKAFPGVNKDTAFLAVVEKGMVNVKLTLEGNGGHSSTPRKNGPIVRMSKAITELEKHPMKPQYTKTVKGLLDVMGRNCIFPMKLVFANMWLFAPLVKVLFTKLSSDTRALVSSTFAYTIISGGNQTNIIPNHVEANINVRLAPFDTVDDVINHIKKVIKDDDIKISTSNINKTYPECSFTSNGYNLIKETVIETYPDTVIAPFVMFGGTDGRHYNEISDCVIRFSPMKVTNEERNGMHGLNEKLSVQSLIKCHEFYIRLLEKL